jgi:tryptophan halogenase
LSRPLIQRVVVLGGGTSGWMSAAAIQRLMNRATPGRVQVTVVEGPDGPIGVGEATIPTLRGMLSILGIDEREFMVRTNATFKQAIKFENWLHDPAVAPSHYFHLFQRPGLVDGMDYGQYWLATHPDAPPHAYAESVVFQAALCQAMRAPKVKDSKQYDAPANYAYHLDAILFGRFLRDLAIAQGARRIEGRVVGVTRDERGFLRSLRLESGEEVAGELFIDCSGFQAYLINQVMEEPFESWGDHLFCDRAVAIQTPLGEGEKIRPYTTATAMSNGWTWSIDLVSRHGMGYVYASDFISDDEAERELRAFIGPAAEGIAARKLHMRVGRSRRSWVKNCVAIGLSAGFLEPLESTGIYLTEMGIKLLFENFPEAEFTDVLSDTYNRQMGGLYDETMRFIVLHYCLTQREDTEFWKANRYHASIPAALQQELALWKHRLPTLFDDRQGLQFFGHGSQLYVLAGMKFAFKGGTATRHFVDPRQVQGYAGLIEEYKRKMLAATPDHTDYLRSVYSAKSFVAGRRPA